jgi:fermentation-respiration switch protein FrsA (DUF1100 family)
MAEKTGEITFKTEDGVEVSANHYANGFDTAIIICPGFLMRKDAGPFVALSKELGRHFDIITVDFRGHGRSKGLYSFTSREHLDLRVFIDYAKARYGKVGVIGFSLGGAIAINEVSGRKSIDSLMVVSAPADFRWIENKFLTRDVVASTIRKLEWNMNLARLGNILLKKPRPVEKVAGISPIPLLIVHGGRDTIISPKHGRMLYNNAREPKRLVIYDDRLHSEDIFLGDYMKGFVTLCRGWFGKEQA